MLNNTQWHDVTCKNLKPNKIYKLVMKFSTVTGIGPIMSIIMCSRNKKNVLRMSTCTLWIVAIKSIVTGN